MFKLCCDCIAGSNRDTEHTYNPTTNDNFSSVQWTSRKPGNMTFKLPIPMKVNDSIEIKGEVREKKERIIMFSFGLDNNTKVENKIEVNFSDKRIYKYTDGKKQEILNANPEDVIIDSSFTLALKVDRQDDDGKYIISVSIDSYYLGDLSEYNISNIIGFEITTQASPDDGSEVSGASATREGISDVKVTKLYFNYQ